MPTILAQAPLREMLEHRRLVLRDRRLGQVLAALSSRTDAYDVPPRPLATAIAGFSAERAALWRRPAELERDARPPMPLGGRALRCW